MARADLTPANVGAATCAAILTGVLGWWAVKEGGYFGTVFYPGAIVLALAAILLLYGAPWSGRLGGSRGVALGFGALGGLAALYGLSALWSPAPDIAVADAQRVFTYVLAAGFGLWLALLLGRRQGLALVPVAGAAAAGGIAATITMLTGDDVLNYLAIDGTLDYPLGYRNANAAFFLMAVWPALGLASDRDRATWLRALAAGTATLCFDMAMLSQSRGSMIALPIAFVVFFVLTPHRARSLLWFLIALLPALLILPAAVDLYAAGEDAILTDALDELRECGRVALATAAIAVALGAIWARLETRAMGVAARTGISWNRAVAGLGVGLAVVGAIAFVAKVGDPVEWTGDRFDELGAGQPPREGQATRFQFNAGSYRSDLWRVALDSGADEPLLGLGGGGFQYAYTREREEITQYVRDAHSVELEVLSELGYPGLLLLVAGIGGLGFAAVRSLRIDRAAAATTAAALAGTAYWLAHTSVDWFWPYPVISAGALALLGTAAAPAIRAEQPGGTGRRRAALGVCVGILALSMVPPFLSERYVNEAEGIWGDDLDRAYDDLDRAADLNPLSDQPLLTEGAIARAAGDRDHAIEAMEEAVAKRPEEWAGHYFLALLYRNTDPERARAEIDRALELNPLGERLRLLERSLAEPRNQPPPD